MIIKAGVPVVPGTEDVGNLTDDDLTYQEGKDVVDGNIVSCTGWPDLPEWSRAFMAVLEKHVGASRG